MELVKELTQRLKDPFQAFAGSWPRLVTTGLFLKDQKKSKALNNQKDMVRPYEAARLLAAQLVGLVPKSQVQLERDLRPPAYASWRIPEWESPEAKALAEQIFPLPS